MSTSSQDQQDTESISSIDSFDPPPKLVVKRVTRDEVLKKRGRLFRLMGTTEIFDKRLVSTKDEWLTEPNLRVLPPGTKRKMLQWCRTHDTEWYSKLSAFVADDLAEWEYTVEVPNRRKEMPFCGKGADILRFYVADLKPLRRGLPEEDRRQVVNRVREGLTLFADYHEERIQAMERDTEIAVTAFELQSQATAD
ncbi:hypothetical protein F53441_12232 [Fusarium austroafricanum]|uniref:Uncharacterized protein n=1 Tax=Fusarium austroafricanum TaxID=2364996 RepID=A0A8H4NQL8_9HYPO|nr:hypothetical protein F53441_12232 [Fusarium austroafricanum]